MAKARLELQKLFRRAQESVESYDDHWSEMLSLENDEADRLEEKKKGKQASKQPIYTNRLDRLGENLKKEVRKVNVVKDELTAWIKKNPRSDSDTREEAEEWIKKIVDMIHGFHRSFRYCSRFLLLLLFFSPFAFLPFFMMDLSFSHPFSLFPTRFW